MSSDETAIPDEAVEAAAAEIAARIGPFASKTPRGIAQVALAAALPSLRRHIADEVRGYDPIEAALAGEHAPADIARWPVRDGDT